MAVESKPLITPDDGMIIVPDGMPKGWRVYSVQPPPTEERMKVASQALAAAGLPNDWWIGGRGVFLVDCRGEYDKLVLSTIQEAWSSAALDEQLDK